MALSAIAPEFARALRELDERAQRTSTFVRKIQDLRTVSQGDFVRCLEPILAKDVPRAPHTRWNLARRSPNIPWGTEMRVTIGKLVLRSCSPEDQSDFEVQRVWVYSVTALNTNSSNIHFLWCEIGSNARFSLNQCGLPPLPNRHLPPQTCPFQDMPTGIELLLPIGGSDIDSESSVDHKEDGSLSPSFLEQLGLPPDYEI